MATTVTPLQANMLRSIARSDYTNVNGAEPQSLDDIGWVWANVIIETAQQKGVLTSLLNAGLVAHTGGPKSDAGVTLTAAGFAAYKARAATPAKVSKQRSKQEKDLLTGLLGWDI